MGNNGFLLIETGAAVHRCTDSPIAHANPILPGIVTATDNHSVDELFSARLIHLNIAMKVT